MVPSDKESILSNIIYSLIPSALGQSIVALFIVFLTATQINRICVKHRLLTTLNLIPGLIFILLSSLIPSFLPLSGTLMAMFFVVLMAAVLMQTYKKPKAADLIFNTGLYIGVACLFSFSSVAFLLTGYIGMIILRSFKFVERLQLLTGFFVPLSFFGMYLYYNDILMSTIDREVFNSITWPSFAGGWTLEPYILVIFIAVALILSIFSYGLYTSKKSIQSQKKIDILFWLLTSCLISIFFVDTLQMSDALLLTLPLSIFISMNFLIISNKIIQELLHLAAVIGILFLHFIIIT